MITKFDFGFYEAPDHSIEWGPVLGEPWSLQGFYFDEYGPLFGLTGGGISGTGTEWRAWLEDDYLLRHCCGTFVSADDARASVEAALVETAVYQNRMGYSGRSDETIGAA